MRALDWIIGRLVQRGVYVPEWLFGPSLDRRIARKTGGRG
jgi:hypothetical protein